MSESKPPRPSWMIPPVWFALALVVMFELNYASPGVRWLEAPANWIGWVVMAAGAGLSAWGAGLFRRKGTGIRPFTPVTALVVEGPYRFTRNPMYLGMLLGLAGMALFLGSLTPWLVPPLFLGVITVRFIRKEEAMLEGLFGEEYRAYRRRVRRWL